MKAQDITIKDNTTPTPVDVVFKLASQEGTTLALRRVTSDNSSQRIMYNFRKEDAKVAGRSTATIRFVLPAVIEGQRVITPELEAYVKVDIVVPPQMSVKNRGLLRTFAAGLLNEPMFVDAVDNGFYPY